MTNTHSDFVAKVLTSTLLVVTIFTWKSGTDPVNVPKLFMLATCSLFLLGVSLKQFGQIRALIERYAIALALFFISCLLIPVIFTNAPLTHQIYGVLGRSLGLLTYISLAIIFLVACTNKSTNLVRWANVALQFSFAYNCFVCLFQLRGVELLGYNNVFRVPLGTFGNPNFISAFLGIFVSFQLGYIFSKHVLFKVKVLIAIEIIIAVALILETKSRQGLLILSVSFGLALYYFIRFSTKSRILSRIYLFFGSGLGLTVALGVFNLGPLADLIYKVSISFRVEYWKAAINMGVSHPITGIGLNSYGDWYRFYRNPSAILSPGPEVVTNSAHSVPLDFLAVGGFPLLVAYLLLQVIVIISIFRISLKLESYDHKALTLILAWVAFTLQSLISIDQISVSIWGWFFGGSIVGYTVKMELNESSKIKNTVRPKESFKPPQIHNSTPAIALVSGFIFGIVGMLVSIPNFRADLEWGKAMRTGDINAIKKAAENWPQDEMRLGNAAFIFGNNKLWDEAINYSEKTLDFTPRSYATWRMLVNNPRADVQLRRDALLQMRKLDPNNKTIPKDILRDLQSP